MNQTLQNSYLQRYQLKQSSREAHSLNKSTHKPSPTQQEQLSPHQVPAFVSKMNERIDGIEVKLTSITNVVKLLQKYTQTRDQQYEKEKENEMVKKLSEGTCNNQCSGQIQLKIRQFDVLSKQFREQLKAIQKMKGNLILAEIKTEKPTQRGSNYAIVELEQKLRDEINKKMDICVKLISAGTPEKGITEKVNQLAFGLNQLENEIKRNRMMFEKDLDRINTLLKENSTAPYNHSRLLENDLSSKSPDRPMAKSKSKNSKSDKSLSKGKQQNRSVNLIQLPKQSTKIKDAQLREALRKKKQHRQRLKVRN